MVKPPHQVIISVGSNIEPDKYIEAARQVLQRETVLVDTSPLIETEPVGFKNQPNFLNGAFLIETPLSLTDFKSYLKAVEDRLGRIRGAIKSGPRTIDLDIILWNGKVVDAEDYVKSYVRNPVHFLTERHGIEIVPAEC